MVWLMVEPDQLVSTKGQRSVGWTKVIAELDFISRIRISTTVLARPRTALFQGHPPARAPTESLSVLSDHGLSSIVQNSRRAAEPEPGPCTLDRGHRCRNWPIMPSVAAPFCRFPGPPNVKSGRIAAIPSSPPIRALRGGEAVFRFKVFSPASPPVTSPNQNASRRNRPLPCPSLDPQRPALGLSPIGFV